MSRSNAPLALSVVTVTVPGDVRATVAAMTVFDDRDFGFSHDRTWAGMPVALRGTLDPARVEVSFRRMPPRIQRCLVALCHLGRERPRDTRRFVDFPEAGLRPIRSIEWAPGINIRVKGQCWYSLDDVVVIPLLQPRKTSLTTTQLSVYLRLARQAFCQGDWLSATLEIIDLSGDEPVQATVIAESDLPYASDELLQLYITTFLEAKLIVDKIRADRPKAVPPTPMDEYFKRPE